eukprot:TRINITY_DN10092_c0_g1::TRINITY_DN10092_c0_g1_i1::g.21100::m.21100 TRINITY_DN10092_c0_g1::TRINITY_DN10092_c0_g1_i1::g.21100  ORF type:complete len:152 (-),score=21.44 TRINITY_DN10092_c0_g1_i1:119-574(-)
MEYLARRFGASNVVTEMQVQYWNDHWKKVDFLCTIYGNQVGVSVARAMSFPNPSEFNEAEAKRLIQKKLCGLVIARAGIMKKQRYHRSILHLWCETRATAEIIRSVFQEKQFQASLDIEHDVTVICTVVSASAHYMFYEHAGLYACFRSNV